jgi:hypothetical protein
LPFTLDTFTHLFDWEKDPQRQEKIVNARLEAEFDGVDTGLSAVAARVAVVEGSSGGGQPVKYRSTNVILYPVFNQNQWGAAQTAGDVIGQISTVANPSVNAGFAGTAIQLSTNAAAPIHVIHPTDMAIDLTQAYRVGVWGAGSGAGSLEVLVIPLDVNAQEISTLTVSLTLENSPTLANGEKAATINANGGGGTEWPAGTVGARVKISNPTVSTNKIIYGIYLIPTVELPNTTFVKVNNGGGTHEAVWDGSNFYTISHVYNQVAKYDSSLTRSAVVTSGDYPHDIISLGSDIWVINQLGESLQQINKAAMTVTNTHTINGTRNGFGLATDGTDIYMGVGSVGAGETPAIVKFTVSGASQASLSTAVNGGSANIPVQYLDGSVWSVHTTNGNVIRIHPSTGSTEATIAAGIGGIYGLGNDGTLIYANGDRGVAVIDPATDTVVATYLFRLVYCGSSNARPDADGRMWGTTLTGAWMLDHDNSRLWEIPQGVLGGPKWFHQLPSGMAMGYYTMPSIDLWR